jgi:hypothetical protein
MPGRDFRRAPPHWSASKCGEEIPQKRRDALPGVTTCIACQTGRDARVVHTMINRRGSKDSQLK